MVLIAFECAMKNIHRVQFRQTAPVNECLEFFQRRILVFPAHLNCRPLGLKAKVNAERIQILFYPKHSKKNNPNDSFQAIRDPRRQIDHCIILVQ